MITLDHLEDPASSRATDEATRMGDVIVGPEQGWLLAEVTPDDSQPGCRDPSPTTSRNWILPKARRSLGADSVPGPWDRSQPTLGQELGSALETLVGDLG